MAESLIVACPVCNTLNRAPEDKLASGGGKCGKCHSSLFEGHPVALNAQSFESHASKSDIPLLIDFWAPWCGPCRMLSPVVEKVAAANESKAKFVKLNTDDNPNIAGQYQVSGIPCLILFKGGQAVDRIVGYVPEGTINSMLARHVA